MTGNSSRSATPGDTTFNVSGDARVGMQAGVVNGSVHIYDVDPSATPEKKFATALNLLDGNMPRRAEELIREAVEGDFRSNKVCYYWALALLSARTFDHLGQDEFSTLQACTSMADHRLRDHWLAALDVIMAFVNCLIRQERFGGLPDQEFDQVIASYEALAASQQEEIRRHLDLIMTGALQDRLDVQYAAEIKTRRMSGGRTERAWKFFEPVPCPPLPVELTPPQLGLGRKVAAGAGGLLVAAAAVIMLAAAFPHKPLLALVFLAGAGGGGYLLVTSGLAWLVRREEIAADNNRHGDQAAPLTRYSIAPRTPDDGQDDYVWGHSDKKDAEHAKEVAWRDAFRLLIQPLVDARFAEQNPDSANKRQEWSTATNGLRQTLATDIRTRYADSERALGEVNWLIEWRAKRSKESWEAGTLRAHRDQLRTRGFLGLLTFIGVAAVVVGLLAGLVGAFAGSAGSGASGLVLGALGAWVAYRSKIDVHAVQAGLYRAENEYFDAEYTQEQAAFERWTRELEDRPTDAEMARWLDYDKLYAKRLALQAHGLANRDLVADAILTEALDPCRKGRVLFGPPRYSRYRIVVFLLTEGGLRMVSMNLDFYTGTLGNQLRDNFRYESISSARVAEVGVRFDSGRRSVIVLDDTDGKQLPDADSLILSQGLRLALMEGRPIDIVVENFDHGFLDRLREDAASLFELALDSSGIKGALRVLESVAAEGRGWLAAERARRNRRLLDFTKTLTPGRDELAPGYQVNPVTMALENGPAHRTPEPEWHQGRS